MPRSHIAWELFIAVMSFCVGFLAHGVLIEQERRRHDKAKWQASNRRRSDFLKMQIR